MCYNTKRHKKETQKDDKHRQINKQVDMHNIKGIKTVKERKGNKGELKSKETENQ